MRIQDIMQEYYSKKEGFEKLEEISAKLIGSRLKEKGIHVFSVAHRVKTAESLHGKLIKHSEKYNSLDDLTDILGFRIITFFNDEVDLAGTAMEELFEIDVENSIDKRKSHQATSFGYLSLHYICSLKENGDYPEELKGLKFEIQIRTGLQHIWAEIEHDIGYKNKFSVTRNIRRHFSRVAGLLEIADDEFVLIRDSMNEYVQDVHDRIVRDEAGELALSEVSLTEYIMYNEKMQAFMREISEIDGAELAETSPEPYVAALIYIGITNLGEMGRMLRERHDFACELAKKSLTGLELDILSTNVGLRFLCQAELICGNYTENEIREFYRRNGSDARRIERETARILRERT